MRIEKTLVRNLSIRAEKAARQNSFRFGLDGVRTRLKPYED
jgi:hypothetical protein